MKKIVFVCLLLLEINSLLIAQNKKTVTFPSADGINVTADIYLCNRQTAPFIILFHQARYSRGEFLEIALKFNELGYNCIAPDLRSGGTVNSIENETKKQAEKLNLPTKYLNSLPDMQATIDYVLENYTDNDVILLGSSYTACLVLELVTKKNNVVAVMSFSAGEYFKLNNKTFAKIAQEVRCPVFMTSAKKEVKMWLPIYKNLPNIFAFKYEPEDVEGIHGAKTLWKKTKGNEKYWQAVIDFLGNL